MNKTLQDTLYTLCSEVTLLTTNDMQEIFQLATPKQARIAFDILNNLGFDLKIYDELDKSRLYVSRFQQDDPAIQKKLNIAFSYAESFKMLQESLQKLCDGDTAPAADFSINFMNLPDNKQQISITLLKNLPVSAEIDDFITQETVASATTSILHNQSSVRAPNKRLGSKKEADISRRGAPTLAKTHLMQGGANKGKEKDATYRWIYNTFFRHFTNYGPQILAVTILILGAMTISILLKGFICPDFATDKKNTRWYCSKEAFQKKFLDSAPTEQ